MERIIVTSQGYKGLKRTLSVKYQEYDAVREERQRAFEMSGDGWHDNPYFNSLQQKEADITRQLAKLKQVVRSAQILDIQEGPRPIDDVRYGSIVRVQFDDAAEGETWEISGYEDSDIGSRKLACSSPLGRSLLGQQVGDCVDFAGKTAEVLSLHASWQHAKCSTDT